MKGNVCCLALLSMETVAMHLKSLECGGIDIME